MTGTLLAEGNGDPSGEGGIVLLMDEAVKANAPRILPLLRALSAPQRARIRRYQHSPLYGREASAIAQGVVGLAQTLNPGATRQALARALAQVRQNLGPELPR